MDTRNIRDIEAFDLRERILRDIRRTAEAAEVRNLDIIRRKYGTGTKEAAEAWHNCRMSAAIMLVDRWGVRFEKEICEALKVDPAELNDYLSDEEVAACVDLEGHETAEAAGDLEGQKDTADTIEELAKKDAAEHGAHLTEREHNALTRALREYQIETAHLLDRLNASVTLCMAHTVPNYELDEKPFTDVEMNVLHEALDFAGSEAAQRGQADEVLEYETISAVLRKYEGQQDVEPEEIPEQLQQDDKTGAADAGSNAEILRRLDELEDRIISLQQITGVLGMDRADRDALTEGNMPDIAALCEVAADNATHIDKRLDGLEDSIHAIGTQVEAIWLHTGAAALDGETQQGTSK